MEPDHPDIRARRRRARLTAAVLFLVAALVFVGFFWLQMRGAG